MLERLIWAGFIVIIILIMKFLSDEDNNLKEKIKKEIKIEKYIKIFVSVLIVTCLVIFCFKEISGLIKSYKKNEENKILFEYSDKKKIEENNYYQEMIEKEYENQNYFKPYVPEGFNYVEGTVENGFVIEDDAKNQYVWIPCTNKQINGVPKLEKKDFVSNAFIANSDCYDENYKEFIKSALENGGFYISRFEIGKENNLPVSKNGMEVYTDISKNDAVGIISKMYESKSINCELINGFAYDTTLEWIKSNNEIEPYVVDVQKEDIIYTGRNCYNNIYDFCDNMLEFSTEFLYDTIVVRGFSSSDVEMDKDVLFSEESRYCIFENDTSVSLVDGLAFRTILYK